MSLIFAVCVSAATLIFAHFMAFKYKKARTVVRRRLIAAITFVTVIALFTVLGIFRSKYLESHDVHLSPVYFIIINLFFFFVTWLISLYMLPSFEEIKANGERMKTYRAIQHLMQLILELKAQKEELKRIALEARKQRARIVFNAKYSLDMAKVIFAELSGEFKSENLIYRTDGKVPDCFSQPLPELEIKEISFLHATTQSNENIPSNN